MDLAHARWVRTVELQLERRMAAQPARCAEPPVVSQPSIHRVQLAARPMVESGPTDLGNSSLDRHFHSPPHQSIMITAQSGGAVPQITRGLIGERSMASRVVHGIGEKFVCGFDHTCQLCKAVRTAGGAVDTRREEEQKQWH